MNLMPIRKKRLFEEIIVAIEKYIQEEQIKPGERLPSENELAAIFQVSKTAVREAMSVLNANGIIETRPGSGIYLKDIQGESIVLQVTSNLIEKSQMQEVLEFRRGLEVEAASLATKRGSDRDLERIRQAHVRLVEANAAGRTGVEEDYEFHYSIILASRNSIYKEVFHAVSDKVREGIRISKMQSAKLPGRFEEGHREHEKIIDALLKRDSKLASQAMNEHLVNNEEKLWKNIVNKK